MYTTYTYVYLSLSLYIYIYIYIYTHICALGIACCPLYVFFVYAFSYLGAPLVLPVVLCLFSSFMLLAI